MGFRRSSSAFPPVLRHAGSAVSTYTDGNLVEGLIAGQYYIKELHDRTHGRIGQEESELYYGGWRFDPVHALGYSTHQEYATIAEARTCAASVAGRRA